MSDLTSYRCADRISHQHPQRLLSWVNEDFLSKGLLRAMKSVSKTHIRICSSRARSLFPPSKKKIRRGWTLLWASSRTFGPSSSSTIPSPWVWWAFSVTHPVCASNLVALWALTLPALLLLSLFLSISTWALSLSLSHGGGGGGGVDAAGGGGAAGHPGGGLRRGRRGLPPPGRARRQLRPRLPTGKVNKTSQKLWVQ